MHRILSRGLTAVALLASLVGAADAHAQVTFYGVGGAARADFLSFVGAGAESNTLDATVGTSIDLGALGTATLVTNGGSVANGRIQANGGGAVTPAYTLAFSTPVGAFGGTFVDVGSCCGNAPFPNGTLRFSFFSGGASVGVFSQIFTTVGPAFFGVAGLPQFDRVEVHANAGDIIDTADLAAGPRAVSSTVPEPGTYALLGTGLVGLAVAARRRRSA